jgi:hypothetical protein
VISQISLIVHRCSIEQITLLEIIELCDPVCTRYPSQTRQKMMQSGKSADDLNLDDEAILVGGQARR